MPFHEIYSNSRRRCSDIWSFPVKSVCQESKKINKELWFDCQLVSTTQACCVVTRDDVANDDMSGAPWLSVGIPTRQNNIRDRSRSNLFPHFYSATLFKTILMTLLYIYSQFWLIVRCLSAHRWIEETKRRLLLRIVSWNRRPGWILLCDSCLQLRGGKSSCLWINDQFNLTHHADI